MYDIGRRVGLFADPYEVIQLFPELLPQQSQDDHHVRLQDRDLENGLLALIEYLTEVCPASVYSSSKFICLEHKECCSSICRISCPILPQGCVNRDAYVFRLELEDKFSNSISTIPCL